MKNLVFLLSLFVGIEVAKASDFVCAGLLPEENVLSEERRAAKLAQNPKEGTRNAIVLFAHFRGELPDQTQTPTWTEGIFDPKRPGSFTHFYDTMSFGKLKVRGEVAPHRYESAHEVAFYLSDNPTEPGNYGQFALEILERADKDIDFARFDNDGPDGVPNSGDDDGFVDAIFIVLTSAPRNFLLGGATGITNLNLADKRIEDRRRIDGQSFTTNDLGARWNAHSH